jgi:hypothetical protein
LYAGQIILLPILWPQTGNYSSSDYFPVIFLGNRKSKLVGQFDTQMIVNETVEIFEIFYGIFLRA